MTTIINEHVSWKGLRVKVWTRGEGNEFPGGFEYHRKKSFMKSLLRNTNSTNTYANSTSGTLTTRSIQPYIFHMSWTTNKDRKKKYYQQMGEWFTKDGCMSRNTNTSMGMGSKPCCLASPNITCYYRDKPSIIPCRESPPTEKGLPSFW